MSRYRWDPTVNFTTKANTRAVYGKNRAFKYIVIHWWDDPARKPSLKGTVATLKNPQRQASAHYIVSGKTVVQLVKEDDVAWHAGNANPESVGIEVDPRVPKGTYETLGQLVEGIRKRRGKMPLRKHNEFMATRCPGTIDLKRIDTAAKGEEMYKGKYAKGWYEAYAKYKKSSDANASTIKKLKDEVSKLKNKKPTVIYKTVEKIVEKAVPYNEEEVAKSWLTKQFKKLLKLFRLG